MSDNFGAVCQIVRAQLYRPGPVEIVQITKENVRDLVDYIRRLHKDDARIRYRAMWKGIEEYKSTGPYFWVYKFGEWIKINEKDINLVQIDQYEILGTHG